MAGFRGCLVNGAPPLSSHISEAGQEGGSMASGPPADAAHGLPQAALAVLQ